MRVPVCSIGDGLLDGSLRRSAGSRPRPGATVAAANRCQVRARRCDPRSSFGDWHELPRPRSARRQPRKPSKMLDKIYSQTLTRTYVNSNGYSIIAVACIWR